MRLIVTPTLKPASNDKERAHLYELLAQRITGHVEPHYIGDDMLRGQEDEIEARVLYAQHYGPVEEVGFITNDQWGFTLGYSPDGLVSEDGLIECKSRRARFQVGTIIDAAHGAIPADFMLQVQTGLMVTGRKWLDFISYSGGLPMVTVRVMPDFEMQAAILHAAMLFEQRLAEKMDRYLAALKSPSARFLPTVRRVEMEMHV